MSADGVRKDIINMSIFRSYMDIFTPIEHRGNYFFKRDDLYTIAGVHGGKARTCWNLSLGATGLITAGSRHSPQVKIVSYIARECGIPCRVHVPTGEDTPETLSAAKAGAEVIKHSPGYNSVIITRTKEDVKSQRWFTGKEWTYIPFGMECSEAVKQTATQVTLIPKEVKRIVIPVGSGMSLAGVVKGLKVLNLSLPVLGVVVGAEPHKRLDAYAPGWREVVTLVPSSLSYGERAKYTVVEGIELDPIYEAKCLPFLESNDLLWIVGIR